MAKRIVHRVRCRKKGNPQVWADVKIVDAFTISLPGNKEAVVAVRGKSVCIVDNTGGKLSKGDAHHCSLLSHMELASSQDDPSQKMYVEVLDALSFGTQKRNHLDRPGLSLERTGGLTKGSLFDGEFTLYLSGTRAGRLVVDKTGLGAGSGSANGASRIQHVNLITEKGNTDAKTDGLTAAGDVVPPRTMAWVATTKTDGISFHITGGSDILLCTTGGGPDGELDVTKMTTDPLTGDPCPPDNTDENIYVSFPVEGDDPNAAVPAIGCNVHIPSVKNGTLAPETRPIDQGPLWWIERVSQTFRPWFWYADVQEPRAFSFFGAPPEIVQHPWAWRGFVLWNNFPVIWILSANNPIRPMGNFGSPSLDLCAEIGDWDAAVPPTPTAPIRLQSGPFGPFGLLPMTINPFNGDPWTGHLNIWQLTGLPQPPRKDGTKPFEPFTNPYSEPSQAQAETAARLFETNWNSVANGCNALLSTYQPSGRTANIDQPPGWSWAVPWYDGFQPAFRSSFQNGIQPGLFTAAIPGVLYVPATCWTLLVDQLDPTKWDTSKLEFNRNPINYFLPLIPPPEQWPPH